MASESHKLRRHRKNFNEPGHAHELTFSCYQGFPFFRRQRTCEWLVEAVESARNSLSFDVWAWVIMPDHVHLIVHPHNPQYDMAKIRRLIKEPTARKAVAWIKEHDPEWLSKIERKRGSRSEYLFWQSGGGYDRNITEPETLLKMIDYIHENPVRKGLTTRATEWKWSSARWFVDHSDVPLVPDQVHPEWLEGPNLGL